MIKRIVLAAAVAGAFLAGYAGASEAWPGVPDRNPGYGYFFNVGPDSSGGNVFQSGFPAYVDSAPQLIQYVENQLYNGSSRDKIGAAFLIQTMLGSPYSRNHPPSASEMADWESRVWYAHDNGLVNWFENYTYSGNSLWQGNNAGPNPNDDAFYYENGTRQSMVFRQSPGGVATYVIKRDCANPLTNGVMPGLAGSWTIDGWSTISNASPNPGQTVTWEHYLQNVGSGTATGIWMAPFDGPSSVPTGLSTASGYTGDYAPGEWKNVKTDTLVIPSNAAAGTRYCRLIGWTPVDSAGTENGRGDEMCATVVIPAKLKAAMSVTPSTMAPGDSASFTPAISATGNSTPINVTCSIARTLYPPAGGSSNLGSQPCVTTGGSSTISIGSGASVTLRTNVYTSTDSIAVGTRVCDVITITNPSAASFYVNFPADRTATQCVTIAKVPYVHFLGGDVWSGGGFAAVAPGTCTNAGKITTVTRASTLTADGSRPGSGVAYGAFALGKITDFGSGSMALVTGTPVGSKWLFSNTSSPNYGFYGASQHCISDFVALYGSATALPDDSVINVASQGSGAWHVVGDLTISGTMPAGARQVYLVDGDVEITADLKYPASYANAAAIPSLVVISKHNLHAWAAANQIDGIYEVRGNGTSSGFFRTCWPKTEPATITTCPTTLTVNGAVYAAGLDLHRTAGADGATPALQKAPAEIFNLSPEVYLNNALNATGQTTITTSNIRELPPRF